MTPKFWSDIFTKYNIEAVFHFAAHTIIQESISNPLLYYENNLAKTISLLKMMAEYTIKKFIFSSSVCVYGDPAEIPIKENDKKNPTNPYGKTKLFTEMILEDLAKANQLEYVCLRYVNVAGALPEYDLGELHKPEVHLIPNLIRSAKNNGMFEIVEGSPTEDGTCIRSYIHVQDIAYANYLALEYLNRGGTSTSFNIGSETNVSVKQILKELEKELSKTIPIFVSSKKPWFAPVLTVDYTRARTELFFQPKFSDLSFILKTAYEFENLSNKSERISNKLLQESLKE